MLPSSKYVLEYFQNWLQKGEIMKRVILSACISLIAFLIVTPLVAQTRSGPGGGSDAGRGGAVGAAAASSPVTRYSSTPTASSHAESPDSVRNRALPPITSPVYITKQALVGTSFYTVPLYYYWCDYYSYLFANYGIYPDYFARFVHNSEPLMTPAMMKLALRRPLAVASDMLKAIDDLETMLSDARAGKSVDKKALAAKSVEIREYAKQIREDRTIAVLDTSSSGKLVPADQDSIDALNPETIAKLRKTALDINRQLSNLYGESSTSTVSAESFKEPSFDSETKAIDKVCRAIEHSSKRL